MMNCLIFLIFVAGLVSCNQQTNSIKEESEKEDFIQSSS
jgi:hypothetical protein